MEAENHQKLQETSENMGEDRISELPDDILRHILSNTDIQEAVRTCILSKNWRSLWSSLPDLDFNFSRFAIQSGPSFDWQYHNDRMSYFKDFVIQFLSHRDRNSTIREFQLSAGHTIAMDSRLMDKCLDCAINHGVQHLHLDAYFHPKPLKFPDRLLASKTLRALTLKQYTRSVVIPKPFVSSSLGTLCLEGFEFRDDDDLYSFPREPFSTFPNLERLTLRRCGVSGLIVSASKLKVLEMAFGDPLYSREKRMEMIATPMLTSFRYEGYASLVCSKVEIPRLQDVYVDISPTLESPYTVDIKKNMPLNTVRMLQQLGNATFVTLTSATIEVLQMDLRLLEQSPSPFPHIKCLKLTERPYVSYTTTTTTTTKTVPRTVMNYLTEGSSYGDSLLVKFSQGIIQSIGSR